MSFESGVKDDWEVAFCQFENSECCYGSIRNNFENFLRKMWLKILSEWQLNFWVQLYLQF